MTTDIFSRLAAGPVASGGPHDHLARIIHGSGATAPPSPSPAPPPAPPSPRNAASGELPAGTGTSGAAPADASASVDSSDADAGAAGVSRPTSPAPAAAGGGATLGPGSCPASPAATHGAGADLVDSLLADEAVDGAVACCAEVLFFLAELLTRGAESAARSGDDALAVFGALRCARCPSCCCRAALHPCCSAYSLPCHAR